MHLDLTKSYPARSIKLIFKGKEKVKWLKEDKYGKTKVLREKEDET